MTIAEAISRVDSLKPNQYSTGDKICWLSELDGSIKSEVIDTHEGSEEVSFSGYDDNTSQETEMLVPAPYDRLYVSWLQSRIDYYNCEYGKFNNTNAVYTSEYVAFLNWYNRTHMPVGKKITYF